MTLLYRGLHIANVYRLSKETIGFAIKVALAGAVMVAAIEWQMADFDVWLSWSTAYRAMWLVGLIGLGALVYVVSALILGVRTRHLKAD